MLAAAALQLVEVDSPMVRTAAFEDILAALVTTRGWARTRLRLA